MEAIEHHPVFLDQHVNQFIINHFVIALHTNHHIITLLQNQPPFS